MPSLERGQLLAAVLLCAATSGCASAAVQRGALIGALSGAAVGAGTGALISNEDLLGSPETVASGNIALGAPESIAAGATIGVVFGAIVGAMIGYGDDEAHEPAESTQEAHARADQAPLAPSAF